MADVARPIIREHGIDVQYDKVVETANAVSEARRAIDAGAEIIVSRGYQASLIKQNTNIPVVEFRIHAQEIGLLLKKAKKMLDKPRPHIAIVASIGMMCDMSEMSEMFDVDLDTISFKSMKELPAIIRDLLNRGIDLIIGGAMACEIALNYGCMALLFKTSVESVLEVLREIDRISYAIENDQQNRVLMQTLMDAAGNGLIRMNRDAKIIHINKTIEELFDCKQDDVMGEPVEGLLKDVETTTIRKVIEGKIDNFSVSTVIKDEAWIIYMAPIIYDEHIRGVILTLQKVAGSMRKADSRYWKEGYLGGYIAERQFSDFKTENQEMKSLIYTARQYALADAPILMYSEEGTEYYELAEAIHNNSSRKDGPFVSISLACMNPAEQMETLFGDEISEGKHSSALYKAQYGTLFIKGIDFATRKVQNNLARIIRNFSMARTDARIIENFDVRIIAVTNVNLMSMVKKGLFSEELFYLLQGLTLEVPALRLRRQDILPRFKGLFKERNRRYHKYLVLTNGAEKRIEELGWPGNLVQMEAFCNRLVLTTEKRTIDEVLIQRLYDKLYPNLQVTEETETVVVYKSPEEEQIRHLLERFHGNRKMIAEELGISPTTLWRRMKKYGLDG